MTMEDAYQKACAMNPEVSEAIRVKQDRERLLNQQQTLAQKRRASSSITGRQGGTGAAAGEGGLRDTLEQLWDSQTG
jgi:hypothetical protein